MTFASISSEFQVNFINTFSTFINTLKVGEKYVYQFFKSLRKTGRIFLIYF